MASDIQKVVLDDKLALFDDAWSPRVIAAVNEQHVKVVKLEGEFVWHHHEAEDELFLVLSGRMRMELRDPDERAIELDPGELIVIPRGVEHRPVALGGRCSVLLVEPASTVNTGSAPEDPRTRQVLERI